MVQPIIRQAMASAPPDVRQELMLQFDALQKLTSNNPAALTDLLTLAKRLGSPAIQPFSRIAIVGSINVGKSTLFNAMTAGICEKAAVSPIPGTTKENQNGELGPFTLIDTPGMNHGADSGAQESQNALEACENSDFIIVVFDASRGITTGDRQIYGYITTLQKPFIVALNKIDLIAKSNLTDIIKSCATTL
ncbi:50S ribosome-binding GTPase, partial [bacterium]|nr:50S ribosome-binding GTPase [bacterium]